MGNKVQYIDSAEVEKVLIQSREILNEYIHKFAKEKAINNQLSNDNDKLIVALKSLSKSTKSSDKSLLKTSLDMFEDAVTKSEELVKAYAKEINSKEVDDLLKELGLN